MPPEDAGQAHRLLELPLAAGRAVRRLPVYALWRERGRGGGQARWVCGGRGRGGSAGGELHGGSVCLWRGTSWDEGQSGAPLSGACLFSQVRGTPSPLTYSRRPTALSPLTPADWTCPLCRDICNCSFHRSRRGWAPTGTLYRRAAAEGAQRGRHHIDLPCHLLPCPALLRCSAQGLRPCRLQPKHSLPTLHVRQC